MIQSYAPGALNLDFHSKFIDRPVSPQATAHPSTDSSFLRARPFWRQIGKAFSGAISRQPGDSIEPLENRRVTLHCQIASMQSISARTAACWPPAAANPLAQVKLKSGMSP